MSLYDVDTKFGLTATVLFCDDVMAQLEMALEEKLGKGSSCTVSLASEPTREDGTTVKRALKIIDKEREVRKGKSFEACFFNEVAILQEVDHRNIMSDILAFDGPKFRVISMPYFPEGTLQEHLSTMTKTKAHKIFRQLFSAVLYLHQQEIVHRDIKPANILVNKGDQITLTDFGLARKVTTSPHVWTGSVGSHGYMPPEMENGTEGKELNLFKCDAYALGATLWNLVFTDEKPPKDFCPHCIINSQKSKKSKIVKPRANHIEYLLFHLCHHYDVFRSSVEGMMNNKQACPKLAHLLVTDVNN